MLLGEIDGGFLGRGDSHYLMARAANDLGNVQGDDGFVLE